MKTLPFKRQFKEAVLSGRKTATTRRTPMLGPDEHFLAFSVEFKVTARLPVRLEDVAIMFYAEEGLSSPDEFRQTWAEIHPRVGWNPNQIAYLYRFERVAPSADGQERL